MVLDVGAPDVVEEGVPELVVVRVSEPVPLDDADDTVLPVVVLPEADDVPNHENAEGQTRESSVP